MLRNPVAVEKSLTRNLQKLDRVRKLCKRFFSVSWTFSITRFPNFSEKPTFYNSHSSSHQPSQNGQWTPGRAATRYRAWAQVVSLLTKRVLKSTDYMDPREQQINATVGAAVLAVIVGAASCFIWCYALISIVILDTADCHFGPSTRACWVKPISATECCDGSLLWLVFRHLRRTIIAPTR